MRRLWLLSCIFLVGLQIVVSRPRKEVFEDNDEDPPEEELSRGEKKFYSYLVKRLKQSADADKSANAKVTPLPYGLPGPFEPLPGRSHNGNYWPLFPFANQYSGGLDLDPSISRHIGGDINVPVPSWGMMDITGRFFNRISDTTTKFGYVSHPVNMLGLNKEDFVRLMSDPRLHINRYIQPTLPLGKVPKSSVPLSCKPPLCNPYQGTFAFGMEHDIGGHDGNEGDINVPVPVSKGVAYRYQFGGNYYYDLDNITVTYGHNLSPLDPYSNPYFLNNDYSRQRQLIYNEPDPYPYRRHQQHLRRMRRSIIPVRDSFMDITDNGDTNSQKVRPEDFASWQPLRRLRRMTVDGEDGTVDRVKEKKKAFLKSRADETRDSESYVPEIRMPSRQFVVIPGNQLGMLGISAADAIPLMSMSQQMQMLSSSGQNQFYPQMLQSGQIYSQMIPITASGNQLFPQMLQMSPLSSAYSSSPLSMLSMQQAAAAAAAASDSGWPMESPQLQIRRQLLPQGYMTPRMPLFMG